MFNVLRKMARLRFGERGMLEKSGYHVVRLDDKTMLSLVRLPTIKIAVLFVIV